VRRLMVKGHSTVVYDRDRGPIDMLAGEGATGAADLKDFVARLEKPRAVWVMVPAGPVTEGVSAEVAELLEPGDTIIDGGNTFWKDDLRRAKALRQKGLHYLDVGTSGGIWGVERGYCLMIGGEKEVVDRLEPIFAALAPGHGAIPRTAGRSGDHSRSELGY